MRAPFLPRLTTAVHAITVDAWVLLFDLLSPSRYERNEKGIPSSGARDAFFLIFLVILGRAVFCLIDGDVVRKRGDPFVSHGLQWLI